MTELTDVEERGSTDIGYVSFEREVRIKFNTKVACMRSRRNGGTTEGKRVVNNFGSLLWCANEKIFSFGRVDREAVECEPGVNLLTANFKNPIESSAQLIPSNFTFLSSKLNSVVAPFLSPLPLFGINSQLPLSLRSATSLSIFHSQLKTHLFKSHYFPP